MPQGLHSYWKDFSGALKSLIAGIKITGSHMTSVLTFRKPVNIAHEEYFKQEEGLSTLQYPKEKYPVFDNGRNKLHNEIDDCIVCDKCAKICPVDCIEIEPVRAVEELGKTSDGTPKRIHAAKFNIDMAKCCFCGLCTTVCPTECLTMTNEYDFSSFEVQDHNVPFSTMTNEEIDIKKMALQAFNEAKKSNVAAKPTSGTARPKPKPTTAQIKPKPSSPSKVKPVTSTDSKEEGEKKKPVFRPKIKPKIEGGTEKGTAPRPKLKPKPVLKKKESAENLDATQEGQAEKTEEQPAAKPRMKPKMKPKIQASTTEEPSTTQEGQEEKTEAKPAAKPRMKPKMKPKIQASTTEEPSAIQEGEEEKTEARPAAKPRMKPKMKLKSQDGPEPDKEENEAEEKKPKRPKPIIKKKDSK